MHTGNSIIMHAPKMAIFETAANLELWPKILPHYRYIRYLERGPDRNLVVMAAVRSGIPISWTSEQIIDREKLEIHFHHLKAWTKGMHVVWSFKETPAGVLVEIVHDLRFRIPLLAPIAEPIIGNGLHPSGGNQDPPLHEGAPREEFGVSCLWNLKWPDVAQLLPASARLPVSERDEKRFGAACAPKRAASSGSPVSIRLNSTRIAAAKFPTGSRKIIFRPTA